MNPDPVLPAPPAPAIARSTFRPVLALLLLAPIVSEVLYGATRVSVIFVLIPEILIWGCGALLIRETIRHWRMGWRSMLLLGVALALAEEFIIQQTSIAPMVGLAKAAYGRVWGVNWVYFLWALGYESVWVIVIPVKLVELMFPAHRDKLWLRCRGFSIASVVFVIGCFMAWYGWTQRARVQIFHLPPYNPPWPYLLSAGALIVGLVASALMIPKTHVSSGTCSHSLPSPALMGLVMCVLGTPWAAFVLIAYGWLPSLPFEIALAGGVGWVIFTLLLVRRWTSSADWGDAHRFALVSGGIVACMAGGFVVFAIGGALRTDWAGKAILNAAALLGLIWLARCVKHNCPSQHTSRPS